MNYFDPYPLHPDQNIVAAWDSQVAKAEIPWLAQALAQAESELLPRFAACYSELRALPRSARRALQRRIARSRELAAILPEWFRSGGGRAMQYKLARSLAGAALLLALGQGIVAAATINVTTTNPGVRRDKKCSLIEAIVNANNDAATHKDCPAGSGADTIVLPANAEFTLGAVNNKKTYGPTGLPVITSPITIEGNGATIVRSTKNGKRPFRLIAVSNTGELTLQDINLSGGSAPANKGKAKDGGAILNHGTLSIENSTISGNTAPQGSGGGVFSDAALTIANSTVSGNTGNFGGGIVNAGSGTATIENSTISDNTANGRGGGVDNFFNGLTIENSTISGNTADVGGGVFNYSGFLDLTNSTISGNIANDGGGLFNTGSCGYYGCYDGILTLNNSLIAGNQAASAQEIDNQSYGIVNANNFNLFGANGDAGVSGFTPGPTDIVPAAGVQVADILGPLADNGGPTQTHALKPGSPALDVISLADPGCAGADQRGVTRPQGTGCDIGAFEREGP